ncbi:unnamed protein product [Rangifer tarandus platyrhynchus]|uniref:Uncharacterized protein n=2 Tax=Rangifer tarandus platyrhynchus TaxID=3082113 RepID=A0ABN8Y6Q5_RANTA|nr:unnamed protein product [Rangifer tarandus platyrhynchus]CAI9695320.1 unnamed protein product [Rangifer tarandus platyrhynchus]
MFPPCRAPPRTAPAPRTRVLAAHAPRAPPRVPPTAHARTRRAPAPKPDALRPRPRSSQLRAHPLRTRQARPKRSLFWAGRSRLPHCGRRQTRPLVTLPLLKTSTAWT